MPRVELYAKAPDFQLADYQGEMIRLSDYAGSQHVFLVLNRGFV